MLYYDYQELVERLTSILSEKDGWGNAYDSATGQTLIELMADATDNLQYMLERRSREAFINTAQLDTSIFSHASELGYKPRRTVAMTGEIEISLVENDFDQPDGYTLVEASSDVFIPKHTPVFLQPNGEEFVTLSDTTIKAGESKAYVRVKEGASRKYQLPSDDGSIHESGEIVIPDYLRIDEYSIEVKDDGLEYYDVERASTDYLNYGSLSYARPNDPVYDIRYGMDGMRIVFGDDTFGRKPRGTVELSYILSGGFSSTVPAATPFRFDAQRLSSHDDKEYPPKVYQYRILSSTPVRGFTDYESPIDIINSAPHYARVNNRAVTNSDHEFLILRSGIGSIADVNSYGEEESGSLIFNMNNVNVSYATTDGLPLNYEQFVDLKKYINSYKHVTTHVVIEQSDIIEAVVTVKVKKNVNVPITDSEFYDIIRANVQNYFSPIRGSIGAEFQHSEFVSYLQLLTFKKNGIVYDITDFAKVTVQPQYKIPTPIAAYDVRVKLNKGYVITPGDVWEIELLSHDSVSGGEEISKISIEAEEEETVEQFVERMRSEINDNTFKLTMLEEDDLYHVIRIRSAYVDTTFSVNTSVGDIYSYVKTDQVVKIPSMYLHNKDEVEQVIPGSCQIVDENGDVVFDDDGNGLMINKVGNGNPIGIDYTSVELIDPYTPESHSSESYYFRFRQNNFQNIKANQRSVIILGDIPESIDDSPDVGQFGRIEIL